MSGIFISYRREDSAGWTGRLAERLKAKFGAESLFMDIDTIQPGTDFAEVLRAAVGSGSSPDSAAPTEHARGVPC